MSRKSLFLSLATLLTAQWILLAFNVYNRQDWALENVLVIVAIYPILYFYNKGDLSKISLVFIYIFLSFHIIGAHYTYSLVPYDVWADKWLGLKIGPLLGWDRNNFDRILHFMYGIFLFRPLYEAIRGSTVLRGGLLISYTIMILFCSTTLYELIEWGAALIFGGDLGVAYVGTQGDPWDSQKDQACAALGVILSFCTEKIFRTLKL